MLFKLWSSPGERSDPGANVPAAAIDRAFAAELTNGVTATTYAQIDPVRRDQMAGFLVRLLRSVTAGGSPLEVVAD